MSGFNKRTEWGFLCLVLATCTSGVARPPEAQPWPQLAPSAGKAYVLGSRVFIELDARDENGEVRIPRLYNRLRVAHWFGAGRRATVTVHPEPREWHIRWRQAPPPRDRTPVVVLELDGRPLLSRPTPSADSELGSVTLKAEHADVHGELLRYEPQAHKNTVGYWVKVDDWAEWSFRISQPGTFEIDILQGCGLEHGGSTADFVFRGDSGEVATIPVEVVETGHFQAFRPRRVGRVTLPKAGTYHLDVRPRRIAKGALMDLRTVVLSVAGTSTPRQESRRPNVVFLVTDDQGTLDAGCYGSRDLFTPYIDSLARDGARFTQAYAHTVCCPARAMLMTGRYPQRSSVNSWAQRSIHGEFGVNMTLSESTLAEVLKDAGYRTALFGKWHLGAAATHGPTQQGFDEFFGLRDGFIDNFNHYHLHRGGFHDLFRGTTEVWHPGEYFPELVTSHAEEFLSTHVREHASSPFFLYVGFNLPHYPEQSIARFDQHYVRHKMPRQSYGKVISTVDEHIGRVLRALDRWKLRENTIVVFMSDNGHSEEDYQIRQEDNASGYAQGHDYGAHGGGGNTGKWIGRKGNYLEGGIRVPAILRFPPRVPAGLVRDQLVTAMDWYPTVLNLAGIEVPDDVVLDGHNIMPIVTVDAASPYSVIHWQWQNGWCVREGDWKLIHSARGDQLVNLTGDKPERTDHAESEPAIVRRLRRHHAEWSKQVTPQ